MNMKKEVLKKDYQVPETEVIQFEEEDVIRTSGGLDEDELPIIP